MLNILEKSQNLTKLSSHYVIGAVFWTELLESWVSWVLHFWKLSMPNLFSHAQTISFKTGELCRVPGLQLWVLGSQKAPISSQVCDSRLTQSCFCVPTVVRENLMLYWLRERHYPDPSPSKGSDFAFSCWLMMHCIGVSLSLFVQFLNPCDRKFFRNPSPS